MVHVLAATAVVLASVGLVYLWSNHAESAPAPPIHLSSGNGSNTEEEEQRQHDLEHPNEWRQYTQPMLDDGICNIDRRSGLTKHEFKHRYAGERAVIVSGVTDQAEFQKACEKEALLKKFGHLNVTLASANTYSYDKLDRPLETYINEMMVPVTPGTPADKIWYHFGDHDRKDEVWMNFFDRYVRPPFVPDDKEETMLSFGLGADGSGVPFHFHGGGFAEVLHGKKRWFLYPGGVKPDFDPNVTSLDWVLNVYPKLPEHKKPLECVIGPGEFIYFPSSWYHATLNLGDSVFVSSFVAGNDKQW